MLEISVTFEEFQLVFKFMIFFTLTLFFSIHERYKVAKIWGERTLQPRPPSSLPSPVFTCLRKYVERSNFTLNAR